MICCTRQLHSVNLVFELSVGQRKIKQRKNNLKFIRNWPEKWLFLMGGLASSSIFWDWHYDTRYEFEILHQCGQRDKTKSQKVFGTNSYVCRSYRGKTGRGPFCPSLSWIGLKGFQLPKIVSESVLLKNVFKNFLSSHLRGLRILAF